jgi:hypothetical protein
MNGSLLSGMEVYCSGWKFTVRDGSLLSGMEVYCPGWKFTVRMFAGTHCMHESLALKKNFFLNKNNINM